MATFTGTLNEFNYYIGHYLKNLIPQLTKKYKEGIGECEHCSSPEKGLHAAHIHGKGREDLIREALGNQKGELKVDLDDFVTKFKEIHKADDLHKIVKILCAKCHHKYDKGTRGFKPGSLDGLEL